MLTNPLEEAFIAWQQETGIPLEELGKAMFTIGEELGENPLYKLEKGEMSEPDFERVMQDQLRKPAGRRHRVRRLRGVLLQPAHAQSAVS